MSDIVGVPKLRSTGPAVDDRPVDSAADTACGITRG